MVRVGSSNLEAPVRAIEKKDKKKGKKGKKEKAQLEPTELIPVGPEHVNPEVDGAQGEEQSAVEKMREEFPFISAGKVLEQTEIDVSSRVGLPPRVRFVQNCVRKVKENGRNENTVIVGVDDMEILFEFFGYPIEKK